MFDFYASQSNYLDHLIPIWFALPADQRGTFYGPPRLASRMAGEGLSSPQSTPPLDNRPIVVAGWVDMQRCHGRAIALLEHGAGQSYQGVDDASFAGGRDRERVKLFLCPSKRIAWLNLARYPNAKTAVVGCPKLDRWAGSQRLGKHDKPVVAITFHHDSTLVPETRWAFPAFHDHVLELAQRNDIKVIGHGHPRAWSHLRKFYDANGIETVEDFDDVIARAECLVVDNSSAIYEAAFADIPVLCLDAPWYRKDVEHGLRFWSDIPGLHIGVDGDLFGAVAYTLFDESEMREQRRAVVEKVYEVREDAAIRAAEALLQHLHPTDEVPVRRRGRQPYSNMRQLPPILPERRLRRLGANGLVLNEARLRWVAFSADERREEQARLSSMTDRELSAAIAETLTEVVTSA